MSTPVATYTLDNCKPAFQLNWALFGRDVVVVVKRADHRHRAGKPSGGDYSLSSKLA